MIKIFTSYLIFIFASWSLSARNIGETEITTDEGIEVFQNEKFYLLKKNVKIISDTFSLSGDKVKVIFNKDLYDITTIFADGNVILNAEANGISAEGNSMEIFLNDEKIIVRGLDSKLYLENTLMLSDGTIEVSNKDGVFSITGHNSSMTSEDINITGKNIDGQFSTIDDNKEVIKLNVKDEKISNIKTNDVDMYANKAIYDKKNSIIELFENVKVIRGNEIITGDYGTLDTDTNSYKVKSNNSNKVKVIITENNE
tara:strand:- start:57 stop:824 length:768 start_codon:yes stop_codon:yes gene_type:complete